MNNLYFPKLLLNLTYNFDNFAAMLPLANFIYMLLNVAL